VCITAVVMEARRRQSHPGGGGSHSPSVSPAVARRGSHGSHVEPEEPPREDDVADVPPPPSNMRRRFTAAALNVLHKTVDGPQHGGDGSDLTNDDLRTLLNKTAAVNVSSSDELQHLLGRPER